MSSKAETETTNRRLVSLAAITMLLALIAPPQLVLAAEEDETTTTYTRVQLWQVERARWGDFVDMFENYDQPILEKLMADGAISEWGVDSEVLHHPEGFTHSTWFSADSMGALAKAGEAYVAAWEELDEETMEGLDADFASMITKHRDYIVDTDGLRSAAGRIDGGYYHAHYVQVTRGKHRDFHSYWKNRMKPVYESLFEQGVVLAYGLSTEAVTTEHPTGHAWWYIVGDADGLDAVDAAFDASWEEMDEEGRRARWTSIMDTVEEDSYRESMTSIIHMAMTAK